MELNAEELDGVLDVTKLRGDMEAVVQDLKEQMMSQVSIRTNIGQLAVCVCVCVCVHKHTRVCLFICVCVCVCV